MKKEAYSEWLSVAVTKGRVKALILDASTSRRNGSMSVKLLEKLYTLKINGFAEATLRPLEYLTLP